METGPIGVFDSGFGGLTVLQSLVDMLPEYDFLYLGDNARTPYGTRTFESVYQFTLEGVKFLFDAGCPLVILACNTASAKALRTIQQKDLDSIAPENRVLGVIRPTTEIIGQLSKTGHVGVLATDGTVRSNSYAMEIDHFYPGLQVVQEACPMWVPLVEHHEIGHDGCEYFVSRHLRNILSKDPEIDTLLLACTHYPLLMSTIKKHISSAIKVISQGPLVAQALRDYLNRHPEMDKRMGRHRTVKFLSTERSDFFNGRAAFFYGKEVKAEQVHL
jgi:glutamate racemase